MVRKLLLSAGMLSSALYLLSIDVIARRQHREYHRYTSQMVSELFAVGAPTRRTQLWLGSAYNLLVYAFATGILGLSRVATPSAADRAGGGGIRHR
jgi:hypothetical protein